MGIGSVLLAVEAESSVLFDLFVVLASASIVAIVVQRVRLAVIPGFLITGALVGPGALGFVDSAESLAFVSHLAVILLMFGIGLHLDLAALKRGLGTMICAGIGSCLLTVALGVPLICSFGVSGPAALALAMGLSLSSTAVVLRIIAERRELRRPSGRLSFGILIVQDLLVVAMLVALPAISRWGSESSEAAVSWGHVLLEAGLSFVGVVAFVFVGKIVLPRLVEETARHRTTEVMMILSVAIAIGCAGVTQLLGFSSEMGAFLAGFLLSATPFRHELRGQIGPLRDLFMAVFFVAVGMNLDLAALAEWWWLVLVGTVLLVIVKSVAIGVVTWSLGASSSVAIIVGMYLAQAGEFSLILIERAASLGVMSGTVAANGIAIVVTSLILTPSLVTIGCHLARRYSRLPRAPWHRKLSAQAQNGAADASGAGSRHRHAIIAGYGTIGRIVAMRLEEIGVDTVIVELNADTVRIESRLGRPIVFGDVSDPEVLESLDVHDADALVLTIPDEEAALRACQAARRMVPDLYIAVRTSFPAKGKRAKQLGANHVTVEEYAAAEDLCHAVMSRIAVELALPTDIVEARSVPGEEETPTSAAAVAETSATR